MSTKKIDTNNLQELSTDLENQIEGEIDNLSFEEKLYAVLSSDANLRKKFEDKMNKIVGNLVLDYLSSQPEEIVPQQSFLAAASDKRKIKT